MSAKVPQFEAIAAKLIFFIDSVILNALCLVHLTSSWNTTTKQMRMSSSQHPFAQMYYLQKRLHCFGARAIFKNGTQQTETVEWLFLPGECHGKWDHWGHSLSHPDAVPIELMSAWWNTFHRQDIGSFPSARETFFFYLLRLHGRSWFSSSINHLAYIDYSQ